MKPSSHTLWSGQIIAFLKWEERDGSLWAYLICLNIYVISRSGLTVVMGWLNYRLIQQSYPYLKSCTMPPCLLETAFSHSPTEEDLLHWKLKLFGTRWRLIWFLASSSRIECFLRKWNTLNQSYQKHTHNPPGQKLSVSLASWTKCLPGIALPSGTHMCVCLLVSCLSHLIRLWLWLALCRQLISVSWFICKEWPFWSIFHLGVFEADQSLPCNWHCLPCNWHCNHRPCKWN